MKFFSGTKSLFLIIACSLLFLQCPPEIPDEIPPVVNIIHPVNGQAVSGVVNVTVGASDETELKEVILYIDGVIVASTGDPLLNYTWDTAPIADDRNHSIYATATDGNGNNGFSGASVVRVVSGASPDTLPPVIAILNPVTGAIVNDTVNVAVQVEDDTGIDRVEYYVDGTLVFSNNQEPYNYQWDVTTLPDGSTPSIFAKAYDTNQNNTVSNTVSVTIQNTDIIAPTVQILYPTAGQTFIEGDIVPISVQAEDNVGIDRVEFFIDGVIQSTDTIAPYGYNWNTTGYGDGGPHSIFVKAFDFSNNNNAQLVSVIVNALPPDTTAPVITILHPTTGSTIADSVNVVPQIVDQSPIDRVEYYVDGVLDTIITQEPFEYYWVVTTFSNGSIHNLFARAYDIYQNNDVSANVSVTILNTDIIPPTVNIIYPAAGAIFTAGEIVNITAEAQDNVGVQRVEFYVDGDLLSTDTTPPYRYSWDTTTYGNGGLHTIFVKAYDFAGNDGSQLVTVTVNP
jgi:hypothetical protein